jgi:hypothetical protein
MKARSILLAMTVAAASGLSLISTSAFAYTTCNREGDCWHTDSRIHFPGVTLSFHNDKWGETHREGRYHWHETDNDHDWHHGYWSRGEWHSG